jgi:hypothetical protein
MSEFEGLKVGYPLVLSRSKAALLSKDHMSKAYIEH